MGGQRGVWLQGSVWSRSSPARELTVSATKPTFSEDAAPNMSVSSTRDSRRRRRRCPAGLPQGPVFQGVVDSSRPKAVLLRDKKQSLGRKLPRATCPGYLSVYGTGNREAKSKVLVTGMTLT